MLSDKKQSWSGKFGFLMAAVGSAVGLGNIWRFPYIAGKNGGAVFLIAYIAMIAIIGFAMLLAEFAIGRNAGKDVVSAYQVKNKKWGFVGILSCIVSFLIISYYCVIGAWIIKYALGYIGGGGFIASGDYGGVFNAFVQTGWQPIIFLVLFMAICLGVILLGVKKGIEKINKVLMPLLFIMLIFIMIVSLTMKGSGEGVKFFIVPNFSNVEGGGSTIMTIFNVFLAALGQAFYSLSIGLGIGTTYGSYADKKISLTKNTLFICVADSLVAVIAGFAILPAVFASGQQPTAGPTLVFMTLPTVFNKLGGAFGVIVAFIFFMLVLFAAITSAIALIEVNVSVITHKTKLKRTPSAIIVVAIATIFGILVSLSQGGFFKGVDLLEIFDTLSNTFLLPIIGLFTALYVGLIWKPKNAAIEISSGGAYKFAIQKVWGINIKFICPILISIMLVYGVVSLFL